MAAPKVYILLKVRTKPLAMYDYCSASQIDVDNLLVLRLPGRLSSNIITTLRVGKL